MHEHHGEQITQSEMEVERTTLVVHADASLQGVGLSWGGYRRAIRTPQHATRQSSRHIRNPFLDHRHNDWARSSEEIQWAMMTKRRRKRLNRCRPSNALDAHRKDPGDDEGGAQSVGAQNNNQHVRYVSFSRRRGIHRAQLESQHMLTQW